MYLRSSWHLTDDHWQTRSGLARLANQKLDDVSSRFDRIEDKQQSQDTQQVVQWIDQNSFTSRHLELVEQTQPGTGQWFLASTEFLGWVGGTTQRLWCPGIRMSFNPCLVLSCLRLHVAGAGKSILAYVLSQEMIVTPIFDNATGPWSSNI